ncbi:Coq4 family protein [Blastomonas aquatica]|nr:Coq4 family protein [Blastomonas aquatica]
MGEVARFVSSPVKIVDAIPAGWSLFREKEDTTAAHRFAIALDGETMEGHFRAYELHFAKKERRGDLDALMECLSDINSLRRFPEESLGAHYARYMDKNELNFDAFVEECVRMHEGYYSSSPTSEAQKSWFMMNNICHDFFHVLGGYDIDAMGELCVQAFFSAQSGSRAAGLLARIGSFAAMVAAPDISAQKMVRRAYGQGREARNFSLVDWVAIVGAPIDHVRQNLNVTPNEFYEQVPKDRLERILVGTGGGN